jgi:hypothetical protein
VRGCWWWWRTGKTRSRACLPRRPDSATSKSVLATTAASIIVCTQSCICNNMPCWWMVFISGGPCGLQHSTKDGLCGKQQK